MPRKRNGTIYITVPFDETSALYTRLLRESQERSIKQLPTVIKLLLEKHFESEEITAILSQIVASPGVPTAKQDAADNASEAAEVWGMLEE